ncbi:MAG: AMIN domain-containing protein, partial [Candidatus Acidiferrales bacterium]
MQLAQNGAQTEVRVAGNAHLTYHVIQLSNPDRLVLDFTGVRLETAQKSIPSNLDPVRQIRAAQFSSDTARVVIDLRASSKFSVAADGNQVTISFKPGNSSEKAPQNKPVAPPVAPKSSKPERVHVAAKVAVQRPSANPVESAPLLPVMPIMLPASLTGASTSLASAKPAKWEMGSPADSHAQSSVPNSSAPETSPAGESAKPAPQAPPSASSSGVQPTGKYSGEPISVNLKDVDLRDFFRLIHEISGLNVVLDPNIKGNLTIVLDEVPWDQALDIVLKDFDLDKQLDGNVLRVATKATIKKEAEQARDLAKAQAEAADTITTTRVLSYAKASDLKETLRKFLSSRGDILADDRSNTLIIRDIPSTIPVMDNLIRQLDKKSQQVEIEARVVAASRTFSRDIGTQFAFSTSAVNGKNVFGGALGQSPLSRTSPPSQLPPLIFGTPPVPTPGTPVTASQPLV